jgi:alpha-beta hydrolase superfamily lysophospholipase
MKKFLKKSLILLASIYVVICTLVYLFQERLIFVPTKLSKTHQFNFDQNFEERTIIAKDGIALNSILFKSINSQGLIFMAHGNGGSLESIGGVAKTYTDLNYDVFILDYRGYGKSEGEITEENQLFSDLQIAYDELKKEYSENEIIILGYSIGTGLAAKIASINKPKLLILEAPYYSLTDLMREKYPLLPTFLLKYKFATNEYLKNCKMPIVIFHGTKDKAIYYGSSLKLKKELNNKIKLIPMHGLGHTGFSVNEKYIMELKRILKSSEQ